ncbi:MAG: hypothetical protein H6709_00260 [Kofleriaceae bacterium]|nr:hypothetical protein [Kofleriaceae bacterium]MCB9570499.1 hypothetical protein [Kofleriaceae bacterium]
MRILFTTGLATAALVAAVAPAAHADKGAAATGDGYCAHVEGVADAERALLVAPELFGSFGYIDQSGAVDIPDTSSDDLRLTLGVRIRLGGLYQGKLTRDRARADCRRHQALDQVEGATAREALAARAEVLDGALAEADKLLRQADDDMAHRRTTAQEATATRLRVDELRQLAATTHGELGALPGVAGERPTAHALAAYYRADADVERDDGKLRRARAWDLSLRLGYDQFLEGDQGSPVFAMVSFSFNTGWFLQGGANRRAAAGRRRMVERDHAVGQLDVTATRLRALLDAERARLDDATVLERDLHEQLGTLDKVGGDASRRLRQTVWFEWIKAKAEHAYLSAHVDALAQVLGDEAAAP